jgi:hypothetical protein
MSIYDKGSQWFTGLDAPTRAAVLAHVAGPLPRWLTDSLRGAQIPTVSSQAPYGHADLMTTLLRDFLTHEAPGVDLRLREPVLPAA